MSLVIIIAVCLLNVQQIDDLGKVAVLKSNALVAHWMATTETENFFYLTFFAQALFLINIP